MTISSTDHEKDLNQFHEKFADLGLRGYWQPRSEKHVMQAKLFDAICQNPF